MPNSLRQSKIPLGTNILGNLTWRQDGVKGLELTSSYKSTKITTNCQTNINNKTPPPEPT